MIIKAGDPYSQFILVADASGPIAHILEIDTGTQDSGPALVIL